MTPIRPFARRLPCDSLPTIATPPISLIVAMTRDLVIGVENQLPWRLPRDLKFFKEVTMGAPIVMGRKTFESIGRVLPGRSNIVISKNPSAMRSPVIGAGSLDEALAIAASENPREIFVIGGGQIFAEALPKARNLYITWVDAKISGDVFFPKLEASLYKEVSRFSFPSPLPHHYSLLVKRDPSAQRFA